MHCRGRPAVDDGVPVISYFGCRWRGEIPLRTVFWRDMLGVGTVLNLLASFLALLLVSQGAPSWLAVVVHFAPVPYNLFLFGVVMKSKPGNHAVRLAASIWLVLMVVV
jgi:hypothetical protein